jgi:hypothetical protein
MQLTDKDGNVFGIGGLEITTSDGKPKIPVINTDITIGVTSIVSGTVGRILFEGAGNVVQESANLFWDNVNVRLGIRTSTPAFSIENFIPNVFGGSNVGLFISDFNLSFSGSSSWLAWGRSNTQLGQSSGIRALWLGNNGFEQGIAFHTASGGNGALSNISGSEAMRITNTKNLLINTTTDAGYKTDINGTLRLQSSLILLNPAFTFGGSITHSANATLVIAGGPGGGENITIGPSNRIFINAQQSRFPNGSVQIASTLTLGNSGNASFASMLLMQGSITAGSGLGRGIGMDTTLVAAANNNVLIGVDINPTFTNGAFTGVTNIAARLGGHLAFSAGGDRYIYQQSPATSGSGSNLIIQSASANTSGQGGSIYIYPGSGAGGPGPGKTFIGNQNGWDGIYMTGLVTIGNNGPNTGSALQVNAGGQNGLNIYWDNLTPFMQYGLVSGRQSRFVNSSSYSFSTNLIIGGTTNAGYMLDVNGIGRMQTSSAGIPNILHISNLQTDAGPGGAIAFYTGNVVGNASRIVAQRSGSVGQSDIAFETNGVRRLFVSANDGNVGIGTTSPFGSFDVRDGDIFATISSNANLRSRLTYQGLYVSRAVDGAYPENIISQSSAWLYNSRNAHSFFRDTILLLSIGALQGTAGININTNGNVLINTSTDAGFKLDVNGTTRVQGVITGSVSAGGLTLGAASANQVGIALNGYFVSSGAISTSNFNARSFNTVIGGQGAGIIATYNSIAQNQTTNNEYFVARGNINLTDGAIDLHGFSFSPTIVSEVGATIKAFSSGLNAASNHYNLFLPGTAQNHIAGQVAIGVITANASAQVQVDSTTRGFLPPRMTNTQMLAIATPAAGLIVYDTTNNKHYGYDGTTWNPFY